MTKIQCTGRDGVTREFEYSYAFDELDQVWHFVVEAVPRPLSNVTFEMTFTPIDDNTVRQTSIFHHHESAYMAKGIPDAILPIVKALLGKEVESSPPEGVERGVFRSRDAEKMWRRLSEKGIAEYVESRRVYRVR
jgi:hypothetical protein